MNDKKVAFLPFHALNDFMRPDFRLEVVRSALTAQAELPEAYQAAIERVTKRAVKVPGFRNSGKAPASIRVRPTAEAFEKSPDLVAAVVTAWAEVHATLRQQVYDLLVERGWEVMPPEADRTKLPGFITRWPKGEDFDALNGAFLEKYPDSPTSSDNISLMVVWVSGRLPYDLGEDEEEAEGTPQDDSRPEAG